ncbi:MAG: DHHA1 domain-containing protein, partial [Armatimonadetes bacterium]|nr:DHHA1 domain-containing protein [Armatimonadota bacterium]
EAQALAIRQREILETAASALKCRPEEVVPRVEALQGEIRASRTELDKSKQQDFDKFVEHWIDEEITAYREVIDGVGLVAKRVRNMSPDDLRTFADRALEAIQSGIVVLGCEYEGRAHLAARVSNDLVKTGYHAGNLIREVAKIAGGGGGGRPDFAQAGGKNPERLDEALAKARELVASQKG